jgi:hypothetical protein
MSHNKTNGSTLYAIVQDSQAACMRDVTDQLLVNPLIGGGPDLPCDLTNARWQHINFANSAGVHLIACNGADNIIWVNPVSATTRISAGDGTVNTISGIDPKLLIHVYAHQKRIWFVEKNSTRGWYLPPDQLFGVAKSFDFGGYWTRGGYLQQIITWTVDDGEGADDHLIAISSEGQVSVFKGVDVDGADTWGLHGVYYAGAPVGRRCACRYGGDVLILTQHGIVHLTDLLKSTKVNPTQDSSAKYIQQLISSAVNATGDLFGWQPFVYPGNNMLIINIPATTTTSFQFAMNDITKAWSEFIGYQAYCWELHNQLPFYGGFGAVYRAWEGGTDDSYIQGGLVVEGADIRSEAQTVFSYFNTLGKQKHFKMVRPTLLSRGQFALSLSVNTDFVFDTPVSPTAFDFVVPGTWDEDYWDEAVWAGGLTTYKSWQSVVGIGTAAAIRILLRTRQETFWVSTDWLLEEGGVL